MVPGPPDGYRGIEWINRIFRPGSNLGEVTHEEKVTLLQHARATPFPIEWDEPFGLVMIESMACGTPVVPTRFGAVPEVIEDGVSGVIVDTWSEVAGALDRADALDPDRQRRAVEERFSPGRLVRDYLAAYQTTIKNWSPRGGFPRPRALVGEPA